MVNEKRNLIDRSRLLRDPYFQEDRYSESRLLRMAIMEQPTVDVVEVVHGQWITPIITPWCFKCSECRTYHDNASNYCPHCGAKMDLEGGRYR